MKIYIKLILLSTMILMLLPGCANKQASRADAEKPGEVFLTDLFTTNQNGRWDTYQEADLSTTESGSKAMGQYYSSLSDMCTENGLNSIAANRLPYTYDELAWKYGCTIEPQEINIDFKENTAEFTVVLSVIHEKEVIGQVEQNGQLQLVQDEENYLIDSVWIANLSDLEAFLEDSKL